eukprot:CAMPEP_0185835422 /NCGR_PEP_ID=MMETSP1353-20130828/7728_1 /TAXON_ID=1077150 /ORGANISM="Erythrolobus australicus, Strain CCMP3124" /LENGTH=105 /DNA_ID=CAMNT_0028534043 /DNA_START=99 /DNA_END=416 /DNA_ORIENTATION=-
MIINRRNTAPLRKSAAVNFARKLRKCSLNSSSATPYVPEITLGTHTTVGQTGKSMQQQQQQQQLVRRQLLQPEAQPASARAKEWRMRSRSNARTVAHTETKPNAI